MTEDFLCPWGQMKETINMQSDLDDCPVYVQVGDAGPLVPYQGIRIEYDGPGIGEPVRVVLMAGMDTSDWRKTR